MGKAPPQANVGPDQAERIGPEQPQAVTRGCRHHLALERCTGLAAFTKARSDDHRATYAALAAVLQHLRNSGRWRGNQRQVDGLRQGARIRKRGEPPDRGVKGIDEVDRPAEATFQQVAAQDIADRARRIAGADDGYGTGSEHGLDALRGHGSSVRLQVGGTCAC
jgi:hypothetical protein